MAHILAKFSGVPIDNIRSQLHKDASSHAEQGMTLKHLWQNAQKPDEVLFIFQVDDLERCRKRMEAVHAQARQQQPDMPLPEMTFLEEA